jgi:hypothetical protein
MDLDMAIGRSAGRGASGQPEDFQRFDEMAFRRLRFPLVVWFGKVFAAVARSGQDLGLLEVDVFDAQP